jgi:tetratricopeptide (TPR) repeat protein
VSTDGQNEQPVSPSSEPSAEAAPAQPAAETAPSDGEPIQGEPIQGEPIQGTAVESGGAASPGNGDAAADDEMGGAVDVDVGSLPTGGDDGHREVVDAPIEATAAPPSTAEMGPSEVESTDAGPARPLAEALPYVPPQETEGPTPPPEQAERWQARIDGLVKEAQATGMIPEAAPLWFEAGRIYESELGRLREAATHYGEANKADPMFLPVIHAARRLFAQLGKHGMVVFLIDQELKLEGAPAAALLVEKGRIHETKLGQVAQAVDFYRQALEVDASYGPAVENLVRHLRQSDDWTEIAAVLEAAVDASQKLTQKVGWLVDLGRLAEAQLKDEGRALTYYERARELTPARRLILSALRRLYARIGDKKHLAVALDQLATTTSSPAEAVQYLMRRAQLLLADDDDRGAMLALESAMARAPQDTLVLGALVRLYEKHEAWGSLVEVMEAQARATHDVSEKVAIFAECGKMIEDRLDDKEKAIRYYYACIEQDPTYLPAIQALGKLYARSGRFKELADVFDVQVRSTKDEAQLVPLLFKLAELLVEKLDQPDLAIDRLKQLLDIDAAYVPALKMLSSLYYRQQRWADLIAMYDAELEGQDDQDQGIYLLEKIGSLYENELADPERAIEAYNRMLELVPSYLPALRSLGRLYAKTGRWEDLININTEESQIIGDQSHVVALLHRNGEIWEEKVNDNEAAIDCYRQALMFMPNYLPALRALGRLYAREGRWTELIDMHREEVEVARTPEQRAQLLCMMAELFIAQLDDIDSAAKCYREVLEELPTYHPAIRALSAIAQQTGDWEGVVETLQSELGVVSDPRDRALMRCRIAELRETQLSQVDEAARMYEEAINESPGLLSAHEQLVSLRAREADDAGEAVARERMQDVLADEDGRVANLRALGELYLYRLGDVDKALKCYERLLGEQAQDRAALRSSIDCALRLRDYRAAIRHAETLAQVEPTADEVANLHLQVATWRESHLEPPEDALRNYLRALEFDPLNPVAVRAVEKSYVERGEWNGLFTLYERERGGTENAGRVADLSLKMGEIAERRLGDAALAAAQFEEALKAQPTSLPAIARLKECYAKLDRPEDQLRMLAFEANASRDDENAIKTLLEVAQMQRDQFGNLDHSIEALQQVLRRKPDHAEAFQTLESLFIGNERWGDLGALYRERAESTAENTAKIELLLRAAQLLSDKQGDAAAAADTYERVLVAQPGHPTALTQIGNLRFGLGQWDKARDAYEQVLQATQDPKVLVPTHFTLAVLYGDHLDDAEKAADHLGVALKAQPENKDGWRRLARANRDQGLFPSALRAQQELLKLAQTPEEQLVEHLAIAELYENGFKEVAQAAAAYDRALQITSDAEQQTKLLEKAAALYQRAGNLDAYLTMAERQAESIAKQNPARAAQLLEHNVRLVMEHKQDEAAVARLARSALELNPDAAELRGILADMLSKDPDKQGEAIGEHRRIFSTGVVRIDSVRALHRAWKATGNADAAYVALELLELLGVCDQDEQAEFIQQHSRLPVDTEEVLDIDLLGTRVLHDAQRNVVSEVLAVVATELSKLEPDDISQYKVEKKDILNKRSNEPLRKLCDSVAANLGGLHYDVYRTSAKAHAVAAHHMATPALVVGEEIPRGYQTREQRFLLGRALAGMRLGHHLVRDMSAGDLSLLLSAIGRAADKTFPVFRDHPELDALAKRVSSSLSRQAKKMLAEPVAQLASEGTGIDLQAYLAAIPLTEARAGLALCGSFTTAAKIYARHRGTILADDTELLVASLEADPVLNDMLGWSFSDDSLAVRQHLRFWIDV